MAKCVLTYFLAKVGDNDIKSAIEYALSLASKHLLRMSEIFDNEGFPIPVGFTDKDVNPNTPRLFSDTFFLSYIKAVGRVALATYGYSLSMASRNDIRHYYEECVASAVELNGIVTDILLTKGLHIRPPYISIPEKVEFVKSQKYFSNILGGKRPLNAIEISHLYANSETNFLGKALIIGFSQVAQSQEIRNYFLRGKQIASKHLEIFHSTLISDDLPAPMSWDAEIMDSTVAPFSDKLMLFHITFLNATGISNYGLAQGASYRTDITGNYIRLTAELFKYAEDGLDLLIKNGWMEESPQADDREAIAKKIKH